jgi:AcrR family transcriptional regulator
MSGPSRDVAATSRPAPPRRRYDSAVRRQRAAETRDRILDSGSALVHGFPSWDWRELTFRAVAERAGVSERTVYRHFATEQELHRAIMRRLEEEAGISYEGLRLADLADVTARILESTLSFAVAPARATPPFVEEDLRRRQALLAAVGEVTGSWPDGERQMAAAVLDVCWAIPSYERLIGSWNLDPPQATRAVTGVIGLILEAVQDGRRPWATEATSKKGRRPQRAPGAGR